MDKSQDPKEEENIVFDVLEPNREMFVRGEEVPSLAIVATHPMHSEVVAESRKKVLEALYTLMGEPEEALILMEQEIIEMEKGDRMVLTADSLVMSLQYEVGLSKLIHLELDDTRKVTIH